MESNVLFVNTFELNFQMVYYFQEFSDIFCKIFIEFRGGLHYRGISDGYTASCHQPVCLEPCL